MSLPPKKRRRGRPARDGAVEGRESIRDAALVEFARSGFKGASIERIASAAGVAKPLVHYHFASKEELWRTAVAHGYDQMQAETMQFAMDIQCAPPDDLMAALIENLVRNAAKRPQIYQIALDEMRLGGPRADWLRDTYLLQINQNMISAIPALLSYDLKTDLEHASHVMPAFHGAIINPFIEPQTVESAFGVDVFSEEYIAGHAAFVTMMLKAVIADMKSPAGEG